MLKNMKILKILRIVFLLPIVIMLCVALIDAFYTWDVQVFPLTIMAYVIVYWWIWLICTIGIIVSSVLIFNQKKKR
jgi:hypothetical protein